MNRRAHNLTSAVLVGIYCGVMLTSLFYAVKFAIYAAEYLWRAIQ
jgi:hypothetical protein